MKTIKVAASKNVLVPNKLVYKVLSVKNSTSPVPGDILDEDVIERYCHSNHWDVTVVSLQA